MKCGAKIAAAALLCACAASWAQPRAPAALTATGTVQVAFTPWDDAEGLIVHTIRSARRQILVQAYNFTSRAIANALLAAQRRGVDVQVIADREQTYSGDNSRIPDLAAAGIPVWLDVRYVAAHNKVMIIDAEAEDAAVITGSYNWTSYAQRRNAENLLVFRRNAELSQAYLENWHRHRTAALPYAQGAGK